jgi:hypothetical protein
MDLLSKRAASTSSGRKNGFQAEGKRAEGAPVRLSGMNAREKPPQAATSPLQTPVFRV